MRPIFLALVFALYPLVAMPSDVLMGLSLHQKTFGNFTSSCEQVIASSKFTSWDAVPIFCSVQVYHEDPKTFVGLVRINIYEDRVDFDISRAAGRDTYFGYTVEAGGQVLWQLPDKALNQQGIRTSIFADDRADFLRAMTQGARAKGDLRLHFKVAYSGDAAPLDLRIDLRKWQRALKNMRRAAKRLGVPTDSWDDG